MLNPTIDPLRGFALQGTNAHVNFGWLRTPEEFTQDCLMLRQRPLFDSWAVSTQMSDDTVCVLQSPLVPNASGLAMVESELGVIYAVVTLQSAGLQLRVVLSLANAGTQRWLRAVTAAGVINLALEIPEVDQVAVIGVPWKMPKEMDIESLITRCATLDYEAFVLDAGRVTRRLAEVDALPSLLPAFEIRDIRLVLALESGPRHDPAESGALARVLN